MNIQLRDSKTLQDAIKIRLNRTQIPKAQLHPSLLNGLVECDRQSFTIRSEMLYGEHKGESNPQDVENLKHFTKGGECEARWKIVTFKQGESFSSVPSELVFTFEDQSKLAIHTQAAADITKLTSALPSDQSARYMAEVSDGKIAFVRVGADRIHVSPLSEEDLRTQCGINGVKWDKSASRETMLKLLSEAIEANAAKKAKKELQPA